MPTYYGVRTTEEATSVSAPTTADSGITIAVGTAPLHQVGGTANQIIIAYTFEEAAAALGYSDNWEMYTLCEVMYTHFKLYGVAPVIFIPVTDASGNTTAVEEASMTVTNGQVKITEDAVPDTITVKNGSTVLVKGTDYDVFFDGGYCVIEALTDGAMASLATVKVAYSKMSFTMASVKTAVIGGYNTSTGKSTGMELIDLAYFKGLVLPDIGIAPGFTSDPEVAAILAAKMQAFSTVFCGVSIADLDASTNATYQAAATAKNASGNYQQKKQLVCWPMLKLGDRMFHYSAQLAALMGSVDAENDNVPSESASNKALQADAAVLADGTEVLLDLTQANYVRAQGIITAYNFVNGFTSWGAYCSCYPGNADPKDMTVPVARMFNYISNSIVLTYWGRIDERMTQRYAESINDAVNMWLANLVSEGHLLGARCEFLESENPLTDLMAGIIRLHLYMTPPGPAQEVDFVMEYDTAYIAEAFGVAA